MAASQSFHSSLGEYLKLEFSRISKSVFDSLVRFLEKITESMHGTYNDSMICRVIIAST